MKRYIKYIIESTEEQVDRFLRKQIKESNEPDYGGLRQSLVDPKPTVYALVSVVAVYCCKGSRYYKDSALDGAIGNALGFIEGQLREGGTFDYPSCNFSSAPDTAFILKQLFPMYTLMDTYLGKELAEEKEQLLNIIRRAVIGVRDGGFHTPNHRWAIAAALYQGSRLFHGEDIAASLVEKAQEYLHEGIDGNADGEYAERSTGNYNAVVNSALITLYEETGDTTFMEYVHRNLKMMLYFMDPDDTIFTENSTRQDKGTKEYGYKYFFHFLYMADWDGTAVFDEAAHKLIADNMMRRDDAPFCLHRLMVNEPLMRYDFKGCGYPQVYRKYFRDSGVLRTRKGDFVYSVLEGKKKFLIMKYKDMLISTKIGISYCDIRSFVVQNMEEKKSGCRMTFKAEGWYYRPFKEAPETSDWWQMDHSKRERWINSTLTVTVELTELERGIDLHIHAEGYEKIPLRFEVAIPDQSVLESQSFNMNAEGGRHMILKRGMLRISDREKSCEIGPGFGSHTFTGHYSGEEKDSVNFTVLMTDYSPVDRIVSFRYRQDG